MATESNRAESSTVRASLGCGTLILIAVIVALFSGRNQVEDLETEIGELRTQIERLEAKIDSLNARLAAPATP
jgi:hypothetical protein